MTSPPPTGSPPSRPAPVDVRQVLRLLDTAAGISLPEAAALFAEAGLPVFPVRAGQKRPLTSHGLLDATREPVQVAAWWRRWPNANIGLPTGAASGVVVLDVDVRTSGSGFGTFETLTQRGLTAGWAGLVHTPSGGLHAYYPAAGPARSWQAADRHVDFRGDGGYVVIPPSQLAQSDGSPVRYRVARIADAMPRAIESDRIRELLQPVQRPALSPSLNPARDGGRGADLERLAAWVAARGEGERNRGLFWAACRLAETGLSPDGIRAALAPAAEHAGLPGPEIAATIRSAARTVAPVGVSSPAPDRAGSPLRAPPARTSGTAGPERR